MLAEAPTSFLLSLPPLFGLPTPEAYCCLVEMPQWHRHAELLPASVYRTGGGRIGLAQKGLGSSLQYLVYAYPTPPLRYGIGYFFNRHAAVNNCIRHGLIIEMGTKLLLKCEFPPFACEPFLPPLGVRTFGSTEGRPHTVLPLSFVYTAHHSSYPKVQLYSFWKLFSFATKKFGIHIVVEHDTKRPAFQRIGKLWGITEAALYRSFPGCETWGLAPYVVTSLNTHMNSGRKVLHSSSPDEEKEGQRS